MSQISYIVLLGILIGSCQGQFNFGNGWDDGFFGNINAFNRNIQDDIFRTNQQIQDNVQKQIHEAGKRNKKIFDDISKSNKNGVRFVGTGQSVSFSDIKGSQRSMVSGRTSNGEVFYRETQDRVINNILHHTDRVYNNAKKMINEHSYTLDLSDPNAKPIPVKRTTKSG